jgi:hypothetical protein
METSLGARRGLGAAVRPYRQDDATPAVREAIDARMKRGK